MAILKRPMFRKGGSANEGIMHGLERRGYADSNWEDIAKAYGYGKDTSTDVRNPLNYLDPEYKEKMIESYTPTETDWSWLKPRITKHTLPSGEVITLKGGMPIKKQETVPPEAITGYDIPIPKVNGIPEIKKRIETGNQLEKIIAKKESLSDRNKRYMDMMAPHMQKRMVADALGAASESFEKSTGNTKQDIARALGAAGRAMSDTRDIADKVSMLTLQGEIQKDIGTSIEAAKEKRLSNYEFLLKMFRSDIPENKAWATQMMKKDDTSLSDLKGLTSGDWKNWALSENIDNKNFGGFLPEDKKGEVIEDVKEKLDPDKFYFDQQNKMYVKLVVENGEKKIKKYIPPKK